MKTPQPQHNAALAKAHQNGWHEGRQYQVDYGVQPTTTDDKQWTEDYVRELMVHRSDACKHLADSHNAALAAEREKSRILGNMTDGFRKQIKEHQIEHDRLQAIIETDTLRIVELEQQLAAERDQTDLHARACQEFHDMLLAAIAEHNKGILHEDRLSDIKVDLSALDKHDEEVRKPLVDALERLIGAVKDLEGTEIEYPRAIALSEAVKFASDALSQVKE